MRTLRVIPAGCPACGSTSLHYDWSRASNLWRVPVAVAFGLIPLPLGNLHLQCDRCRHRFTSASARAPRRVMGPALLAGALLTSVWASTAGEPPAAAAAGVVAATPGVTDLGPGWSERKIVFAIDPLDQPTAIVNEAPSREPANRERLLARVTAAIGEQGAVGIG